MRMILAIDDFLLDRVYQPIVDRFSRLWGIGFIALAEFTMTGAFIGWFCCPVAMFLRTSPDSLMVSVTLICIHTLAGGFLCFIAIRSVRLTRRRCKSGFLNPMRLDLFGQRFANVMVAPLFLLPEPLDSFPNALQFFGAHAWAILIVSGYYYLSCQEGPPQRQRRRIATPLEAPGAA